MYTHQLGRTAIMPLARAPGAYSGDAIDVMKRMVNAPTTTTTIVPTPTFDPGRMPILIQPAPLPSPVPDPSTAFTPPPTYAPALPTGADGQRFPVLIDQNAFRDTGLPKPGGYQPVYTGPGGAPVPVNELSTTATAGMPPWALLALAGAALVALSQRKGRR